MAEIVNVGPIERRHWQQFHPGLEYRPGRGAIISGMFGNREHRLEIWCAECGRAAVIIVIE